MARKQTQGGGSTTTRRRRRKGRRMELVGHQALRIITANLGPEVAIFEAAKNAWEAGATVLELFPSRKGGWLTLRDNGSGVPRDQIISKVGNFGSSGKKIDRSANLGWGASLTLASKCPDGAVFTTWTSASGRWAYSCLLGLDDNDDFALLEHGSKNEQVRAVEKPANISAGTEVVFTGIKFDADWLELELGDHFLTFCGAKVLIYQSDPAYENCGEPREVRSLVDRAVEARDRELGAKLKTWGVFETAHAKVTWVILGAESRTLSPCYEAWNNEVFKTGDASTLNAWGPWAAPKRIVWIVEAIQPDGETEIAPDLLRQMVTGWNFKYGRMETAHMLASDPDLEVMRQFMTAFEDAHYDPANENAAIQETNRRWRTGRSNLPSETGDRELPTKEPAAGEEEGSTTQDGNGAKPGGTGSGSGSGSSNGQGGGKGGPRRGKKKPKKSRPGIDPTDLQDSTTIVGEPEVRYAGKAELGNTPVRYVERRNRIIINRDVGIVRDLLEEASAGRKWKKVRELIGAHMVHAVVEYFHTRGMTPTEDVLLGMILAPSAAIDMVRKASSTPKATKKKTAKKPAARKKRN